MRNWCAVAALIIMTTSADAASVAAGVGVRTCVQFARDYQNDPNCKRSSRTGLPPIIFTTNEHTTHLAVSMEPGGR